MHSFSKDLRAIRNWALPRSDLLRWKAKGSSKTARRIWAAQLSRKRKTTFSAMPRVAHGVFKALLQIITIIRSSANVYQSVKYQGMYVVFFWQRHSRLYIYIYISCIPHSIPLVVSHWSHVVNKPSLENLKANSTGKAPSLHHQLRAHSIINPIPQNIPSITPPMELQRNSKRTDPHY